MNQVAVFNFKGVGIRTLQINDEPCFVGNDVASILGYSQTAKAVRDHVDKDDKGVSVLDTPGGKQSTTVINESGLYSLILSSKLPTAKEFKHWITSKVLPSIRKNGSYLTDQKAYDITHNPDSLAELLLQAGNQLKEKDIQISEMKPKVLFANAVETSDTSILVGELAKLLNQNGVDIGSKRLFAWLRNHGYLIAGNHSDRNLPTQRSMDLKIFEIKERTYNNPDGSVRVTRTPKVTGKGQTYFVNKFLKEA
ncbi:phage antirepressor [Companilactobacillus jidongensis]|uniref:phage antirepressor n=1 Tax=Companilactobacillus jidongensis TaxID=2486006 RepID=UPI000F7BA91C|nr:phage antirepressor [Companilactobacillus jidongensis]